MKCPICGEELYEIGVVVQATHTFDICTASYGNINEIEKTLSYYCPECGNDLPFETTRNYINQLIDKLDNEVK